MTSKKRKFLLQRSLVCLIIMAAGFLFVDATVLAAQTPAPDTFGLEQVGAPTPFLPTAVTAEAEAE